jgi:hypothetical protein
MWSVPGGWLGSAPPETSQPGSSNWSGQRILDPPTGVRHPARALLNATSLSSWWPSLPSWACSSRGSCKRGTPRVRRRHSTCEAPRCARTARTDIPRLGLSPSPASVVRYLTSTIYLLGIDFQSTLWYIPRRYIGGGPMDGRPTIPIRRDGRQLIACTQRRDSRAS